MRQFISPVPKIIGQKAKLMHQENKQLSSKRIKQVQPKMYFKRRFFKSQIKYPNVLKDRKFKFQKQRKNFSSNELSSLLEVTVMKPNEPAVKVKTPKGATKQSIDKESTESFENYGKGLVLIVSGEDNVIKEQNFMHDTTKEINAKEIHSKRTSKDLSSNVVTRDVDNSECVKSEIDPGYNKTSGFRNRKPSGSFTAVFASENFSSKEISVSLFLLLSELILGFRTNQFHPLLPHIKSNLLRNLK